MTVLMAAVSRSVVRYAADLPASAMIPRNGDEKVEPDDGDDKNAFVAPHDGLAADGWPPRPAPTRGRDLSRSLRTLVMRRLRCLNHSVSSLALATGILCLAGGAVAQEVVIENGARVVVGADGATSFDAIDVHDGTAVLNPGPRMRTGRLTLGDRAGGRGVLHLDDTGLDSRDDVIVGGAGDGELAIHALVRLNVGAGAGRVVIARDSGSVGLLSLGAGSGAPAGILSASSVFGGNGDARVRFNHSQDDYRFTAGLSGHLSLIGTSGRTRLTGANAFSGSIAVENGGFVIDGSTTVEGSIRLGVAGVPQTPDRDLRFTVADGAQLAAREVIVGGGDDGEAIFDLQGASASAIINRLAIGQSSAGRFLVSDGGRLDAGLVEVGGRAASSLELTGASSALVQSLTVGKDGDGGLLMTDGSRLATTDLVLGADTDSTGTLLMRGQGTRLEARDVVLGGGLLGQADGLVSDSATGESRTLVLGREGFGRLTVDRGGRWRVHDDLIVGERNLGVLRLAANGRLDANAVRLGAQAESYGLATVDGVDARLVAAQTLTVGDAGYGELLIATGGAVVVSAGVGPLHIAARDGSRGVLSIGGAGWDGAFDAATGAGRLDAAEVAFGEGDGWLTFNHTETDYRFDARLTGAGRIEAAAGRTVLMADSDGWRGLATVGGQPGPAELAVNVRFGGEISVLRGGALSGVGAATGYVSVADGGRLIGRSGQTLTIGNLSLDRNAHIDVTLGGAGGPTLFAVTGAMNDAGVVNIAEGVDFSEGVHSLFTYSGALQTQDGVSMRIGDHRSDLEVRLQKAVVGQINLIAGRESDLMFWDGGKERDVANGTIDGGSGQWLSHSRAWTDAEGSADYTSEGQPRFLIFSGPSGEVELLHSGEPDLFAKGLQFATDGYRLFGDSLTLTETNSAVRVGLGGENDAAIRAVIDSALVGSGGLVKTDGGTLTLNGANTYTGQTVVRGGSLVVNGSVASGVAVNNGGRLAGTGLVAGTVAVDLGGVLSGTQGQTLTMGGLNLAEGAQVNVSLGQASASAALFDMTGDLVLDGVLNVTDAGGFGAGVYSLMRYGGALTDRGLAIGATPQGVNASDLGIQTSVAGQVNLVSDAAANLQFWDGGDVARHSNGVIDGGAGVWTASNANWTGANGAAAAPMRPAPGFAVFQGAAGVVTVDGSAGAVGLTGMQFVTDGYRVTGDALSLTQPQTLIRVGDGTQAGATTRATIDAVLAGDGGLVKTDFGTLVLSGANTYEGGTTVNGGTLIGNAASIRGVLVNNALTTFDQATDGTFAGDVSGTGVITKSGDGRLVLTGRSTGRWIVADGELRSASDRFTGDLQIDQGATFTFDQAQDGVYAGRLTGAGALRFDGGGMVNLTGASNAFTGSTTLASGTLKVNGSLGGKLEILEGARLMGSGRVGSTRIAGTVAPGNSIGRLTIDGDLTFAPTGRYEVEIAPDGRADRIDVTGRATLQGGSVVALSSGDDYVAGTTYRILDAVGGLSGTFASLQSDLAFLTGRLTYNATGVDLVLDRNAVAFVDVSETRNQLQVAPAIEALGDGSTIYDRVVTLNATDARVAYDQLSGEGHAGERAALFGAGREVRSAVLSGSGGLMGEGLWTQAWHTGADVASDGNAAPYDRSLSGVVGGAERRFGDLRVGAVVGFGTGEVEARGAEADVESRVLGAYAVAMSNGVRFTGGLIHSWHAVETDRAVRFNGYSDDLTSEHDSRVLDLFAEAALPAWVGDVQLESFVGLARSRLSGGAFVETGGEAALDVDGDDLALTSISLGLRGSAFVGEAGRFRLYGGADLTATAGDRGAPISARFEGEMDRFDIRTVRMDPLTVGVELGAETALGAHGRLSAGYVGSYGARQESHGAQITARWTF